MPRKNLYKSIQSLIVLSLLTFNSGCVFHCASISKEDDPNAAQYCLSSKFAASNSPSPDRLARILGSYGKTFYICYLLDNSVVTLTDTGFGSFNCLYIVRQYDSDAKLIKKGKVYITNGAMPVAVCGIQYTKNISNTKKITYAGSEIHLTVAEYSGGGGLEYDPGKDTLVSPIDIETDRYNVYKLKPIQWDRNDSRNIDTNFTDIEEYEIIALEKGFPLNSKGIFKYPGSENGSLDEGILRGVSTFD